MKKSAYKWWLCSLVCVLTTAGAAAQEKDRDQRWAEAGRQIGEAVEEVGKTLEENFRGIFNEDFGREMAAAGQEVSLAMRSLTGEAVELRDWEQNSQGSFDEEKSKKISRTFKVKASDQLSVENKFGKVHVNTWDRSEITVEVTMTGRANSAERAGQVLDAIDVKVSEEPGLISFRTGIGKIQNNNNNGKKGFEINYTINMPRNNPLKLKNSFGDVYVGDLNGKADLHVAYGGLKAERLNHNENFVKVAFGSGSIGYVKGGTIDIDYISSKMNIERVGNVTISSGFSKLAIEKAGNIEMKARYGEVQIGTVDNLTGSAGFSGFDVDHVNEKIIMKVQYCNDFDVKSVAKNFREISLDGSFSKIRVRFDPATSFNFDVNLQFAELDANNLNNFSFVEKKSTSKVYRGNFGTNQGGIVKINSRYGDVNFNWND